MARAPHEIGEETCPALTQGSGKVARHITQSSQRVGQWHPPFITEYRE
jgi:hypothetical protein